MDTPKYPVPGWAKSQWQYVTEELARYAEAPVQGDLGEHLEKRLDFKGYDKRMCRAAAETGWIMLLALYAQDEVIDLLRKGEAESQLLEKQ